MNFITIKLTLFLIVISFYQTFRLTFRYKLFTSNVIETRSVSRPRQLDEFSKSGGKSGHSIRLLVCLRVSNLFTIVDISSVQVNRDFVLENGDNDFDV